MKLIVATPSNAARSWRSSKATKQTRTPRYKAFKCCNMLLEDEGDETRPRGCKPPDLLKYYPTRPCAPSFFISRTFRHYKHISYFFNKCSLSLYVYTRGLLGCFLGFWPLGQNPAGAKDCSPTKASSGGGADSWQMLSSHLVKPLLVLNLLSRLVYHKNGLVY